MRLGPRPESPGRGLSSASPPRALGEGGWGGAAEASSKSQREAGGQAGCRGAGGGGMPRLRPSRTPPEQGGTYSPYLRREKRGGRAERVKPPPIAAPRPLGTPPRSPHNRSPLGGKEGEGLSSPLPPGDCGRRRGEGDSTSLLAVVNDDAATFRVVPVQRHGRRRRRRLLPASSPLCACAGDRRWAVRRERGVTAGSRGACWELWSSGRPPPAMTPPVRPQQPPEAVMAAGGRSGDCPFWRVLPTPLCRRPSPQPSLSTSITPPTSQSPGATGPPAVGSCCPQPDHS